LRFSDIDIDHTKTALGLAAEGIGLVSPNPLVGCVITASDGRIVGKGSYRYDRVLHAETIALTEAGERARGGTAYVSLEPHSHYGKTPPCTDALIQTGIRRVVCPIEDPNPLVSGRGFDSLRNAGIEVVTGILADEAARLNEKFICWHTRKRPLVHLKLAMSLDGRISIGKSISTSLSGEIARARVQDLRHEYDAILIGGNTAALDNPSLTDRSGKPRRRPLTRIVLDNRLQTGLSSTLVATASEVPTIIFTSSRDQKKREDLIRLGVQIITEESGGRDLSVVLEELRKREIQSVLVEGGSRIAGAFVDARLVDKVTFLISPILIGGADAPVSIAGLGATALDQVVTLKGIELQRLGDDIEITGRPA
jgi:diaminohydroxyphosphoribosylaminopyrimidine deaminase/5-amino-6-(5-phosphoribosylamino)uracil reductase